MALLALPSLPGVARGIPTGRALPSLPAVDPAASVLPAALAQPWAARTGYDATHLSELSGAVQSTAPNVSVVVTLWPRDASYFSPSPGAPPLSTAQIVERYAPLPAQYEALVGYFASRNLTVVHAWPDELSLTLQGSAAAVDAAFGTELVDATWEGRSVQAPLSAPALPPSIAGAISSISGLSSGFTDFTIPLLPASLPKVLPGRTSTLLWPAAVHGIYDLDGLYNYSGTAHWATGIGIALVLWGAGFAPNDIQSFFSSYYPSGFPAIEFAGYPIDGAPRPSANAVNDPSNVTSEMTLDMEWAGSAAPGATLSAVYAPDGPAKNGYSPTDAALEDALNYAVQSVSGVRVVSMSFGTPDGSDPSFQAAFTQILADASTRGLTLLAASGDTGGDAQLGCQGGASPEFPAASEYVVAVGGTAPVLAVNALGAVTGLSSEPSWNRSGGGFSKTVSAPAWQQVGSAAGPIRDNGGLRGLPDVAGPADDNVFFYNGQEAAGAGTSFASPMWAGMIAEMDAVRGTPLGFVTPRLYAVGSEEANRSTAIGVVDITQGSNCLGPAAVGWDTATGWGSPRGLTLYQDLSSTYVNVSLTVSTGSVAPGQSFDASVYVTNTTSLAPISGASVTFALDSVGYVGPCGGSIATASGSTTTAGAASSSLTVPGCYLGLTIQVTATVSGGPYFGSNQTTVHVNLLGLAGFLAIVQVFPYNYIAFGAIMLIAVLIGWRIGNWRGRGTVGKRPARAPPGKAAPPATRPAAAPRPAAAVKPTAVGAGVPAPLVPIRLASPAVPASVAVPPFPPSADAPSLAPLAPTSTAPLTPAVAGAPEPLTTASAPPIPSPEIAVRVPPARRATTARPATARPASAGTRTKTVAPRAAVTRRPPPSTRGPVAAAPAVAAAPRAAAVAPPTPVVAARACPVCSAKAEPGATTCAVCGAPLS